MRKTVAFLLLFMAAGAAHAATLRETVDRTFDAQPGASVSLENVNGRVTVTGWDQPRIRIVAEKTVERTDEDDARAALKEMKVDIQQRGNSLVIRTETPRNRSGFWDLMFGNWNEGSVRYEISVPRSVKLDVENTNGALVLNGVEGQIRVETTNGRIEMSRCGGAISASSTNGRITADLVSLAASGQNRFETTNGRIELTLPSNARVELDAETTNGGVETDLPVATRGGSRGSLRGAINGGGSQVRVRTTNGGIRVRSSAPVPQPSR